MKIPKKEIAVDVETMTAKIDAMENNQVYFVQDGKVVAYPLPAYGTMEISCQNYKIGRPKYHISAD